MLIEPERAIGIIVGRFVLEPIGYSGTRLVFRESLQTQGPPAQGPAALRVFIWDPAHFVMVRRVLEGFKERAEDQPLVPGGLQVLARSGWLLAGGALLGVFLAHRTWWPWLVVPAVLQWITIAGGLAFGRHWWPAYVLMAAAVLLVLLLAPDAYAAFGLMFLVLEGGLGLATVSRTLTLPRRHRRHRAAAVRT